MNKARPSFLGIGAHKAGTTWLYKQFANHPEIWMPLLKELHYFDRARHYPSPNVLTTSSPFSRMLGSDTWERPRMSAGFSTIRKRLAAGKFRDAVWLSKWIFGYYNDGWYCRLFTPSDSSQVCGEITPSYSILNKSDIARIKTINPDIKLIFMIRNPIDRAWSAIRFRVSLGFSTPSLDSEDEIIAVMKKPVESLRGEYEQTLENYLSFFDSSQILVGFFDAILHDPMALMSDVSTFLGVSPFPENAVDNKKRVNVSPKHQMPDRVREYLHETYAPMINRFAKSYGSYATLWEESLSRLKSQEVSQSIQLPATFHP